MNDWLFLPPFRSSLVAGTAVLLAMALILRLWRERRVAPVWRQAGPVVARCSVIGILIAIALNPTSIRSRQIAGRPRLIVLIDTSASMATADVSSKPRLAAALDQLLSAPVYQRLSERFTLDVRSFDSSVQPQTLGRLTPAAARGTQTDLAGALHSAVAELADAPAHAGVLVISDGRTTTGASEVIDAARLGLARSVPLWTWSLGGDVERRDLWVQTPGSEVLAFAGSEVELTAMVRQTGLDHRTVRAELWQGEKRIESVEAIPNSEKPVKITVKAPTDGEQRFEWRVAEAENEADLANNRRAVYVRSVGQKVRVLLVEGQPHWDSKFLVQSLKRSDRVDVTALYRLSDERQFAVITAGGNVERRQTGDLFPRSVEDFRKYDVVIFGRSCEAFFNDKTSEQLTTYVGRFGGGLIFSRGKSYGGRLTELAKLEPVVWDQTFAPAVRMHTSGSDAAHPVLELAPDGNIESLLSRLPEFDQVQRTTGIKPLAVVVASGAANRVDAEGSEVILAHQRYGQGRVVTVNAGGLWRWAFRESENEVDSGVYERFWLGMLRWMLADSDFLAGHEVAVRTDRRRYVDDQRIYILSRCRNVDAKVWQPALSITGPSSGGGAMNIDMLRDSDDARSARIGPLLAGFYEVRLQSNIGQPADLVTTFEVVSDPIEKRQLSADPQLMAQLAEASRGKVIDAADLARLDEVVAQWRAMRHLDEDRHTLWDNWWVLSALVAALGAEWLLRRREGLL